MDSNKARRQQRENQKRVFIQVIVEPELHDRMRRGMRKAEDLKLPGWIKSGGITNTSLFIRACIESTCDALEV